MIFYSDPECEDKVELRMDPKKGRCLYSKINIPKGTVIFEEDPIVSRQFEWNKTYGYQACDHCLRPLESLEANISRLTGGQTFPLIRPDLSIVRPNQHKMCPGDCETMYCSEKCLVDAWKQYHKIMCCKLNQSPLLQLLETWKSSHYPPESISILLIIRIIATIHLADDSQMVYDAFMQMCQTACAEQEVVVRYAFGNNMEHLSALFRDTVVELCHINDTDDELMADLLSPDGFLKLLAMVARNGQGVGTSVLASWANDVMALDLTPERKSEVDTLITAIYESVDSYSAEYLNNEGSALYLRQSCVNHSCEPNAEVTFPFSNYRMALRAVRDIKPGDEILISYLDECALTRSCHSRRKFLNFHYLFICECTKCVRDAAVEANVTSDEGDDSENEEDDDE